MCARLKRLPLKVKIFFFCCNVVLEESSDEKDLSSESRLSFGTRILGLFVDLSYFISFHYLCLIKLLLCYAFFSKCWFYIDRH